MKLTAPIYQLKRQARLSARQHGIPLNQALDAVARHEGFASWSLLARHAAMCAPTPDILDQLHPGDLVLLGARRGHGKTLLGLELLAGAVKSGRYGMFFTLEDTATEVQDRLRATGIDPDALGDRFVIDTSDHICAAHIVARLAGAPSPVFAVVDYLQLLDQRRDTPALSDQIAQLHQTARDAGAIIVLLSQIDRRFETGAKAVPDISDVRLPNPLDLAQFSKTCFLHEGALRLEQTG